MLISGIFAIIFREYGDEAWEDLPWWDVQACNSKSCAGNGVPLRVGFCLVCFHAAHLLALIVPTTPVACHSNGGCFCLKVAAYAGLLIWTFWWDNGVFNDFADVARIMSYFFLFYQILLVWCWSQEINDAFVVAGNLDGKQVVDEENKRSECCITCFQVSYLLLIVGLLVCACVLNGLFWDMYGGDGCDRNNFFIIFTFCMSIPLFILSKPYLASPNGNFFTGACYAMYASWLLYSALSTDNDWKCNDDLDEGESMAGKSPPSMWIGLF
eukprot:UN24654